MPDYRHRKKRVKKVENEQKPSRKETPIVKYDAINIELGKIMEENERKRRAILKDIREQKKKK